jgi:hypothetical protein
MSKTIEITGPDDIVEGLQSLGDLVGEHIALLREREEAKRLLAPENPEDWPTFEQETLLGALRNRLATRVLAMDTCEYMMEILDRVADELGFPRTGDAEPRSWRGETLIKHLQGLLDGERQAMRFRRDLVAMLGLQPGMDPLDEIKRRLEGGVIETPGRQRLERQLRGDLLQSAGLLEKAQEIGHGYVGMSEHNAKAIAHKLRVIHDSTVDA